MKMIAAATKSQPTLEGAGVHLHRAFGYPQVPSFDPFLLLDDFRGTDPSQYIAGFPWHPHRGIETVTYLLEGTVEHGDSMGNAGVIGPGDAQWMTAGSGIVHQEMPKPNASGAMGGFQLWANLPATHKMMPPRYQEVKANQIPVARLGEGVEVRVVAGREGDQVGPVKDIVTDPTYLDVTIPGAGSYRRRIEPDHSVFAYVFAGEGYFDNRRDPVVAEVDHSAWWDLPSSCAMGNHTLILYEEEGDEVVVMASDHGVRFLLVSGRPLGEPVAWAGPIVMNTREELQLAFREYRDGTFVK